MNSTVIANWIKTNSDEYIFNILHLPPKNKTNGAGIIIINPIGPEYMFCHRTIRSLAERLAKLGYHVMRYDHLGTGDSSGDMYRDNLLESWVSTLYDIQYYFGQKYQLNNTSYISFRSGSLILTEYLKQHSASNVSYVYPCVNGRSWIRDMQMMNAEQSDNSGTIDARGYPITSENGDQLSQINMLENEITLSGKLLLVEDNNALPNKKLINHLTEQSFTDHTILPGMNEMLKVVSYSKVPIETLKYIANWFAIREVNKPTNVKYKTENNVSVSLRSENYTEDIFSSDDDKVFGVITQPINHQFKKVVILVNAGSGHHVGPNRINVQLARYLATKGVACVRVDLSYLGDSASNDETSTLNPFNGYESTDIVSVISELDQIYNKSIILVGLCSGAHNQFHAALHSDSKNISKLVLINPINFYYKEGQSFEATDVAKEQLVKAHYNKNVYSADKWKVLLTDPKRLMRVIGSVIKLIMNNLKTISKSLISILGSTHQSPLDIDLHKLNQRGISVSIICSETDPGIQLTKDEAPIFTKRFRNSDNLTISRIKDSDHNFTSMNSIRDLQVQLNDLIG